jgi:hypothetical protein
MIPEQHSDRLEAGALCFARLIGLLLGDPRQRPAKLREVLERQLEETRSKRPGE